MKCLQCEKPLERHYYEITVVDLDDDEDNIDPMPSQFCSWDCLYNEVDWLIKL